MQDLIDVAEAASLQRFLAERGIAYSEEFDVEALEDEPPFEAELVSYDDEEEQAEIAHWEVGWSWWSKTQELMAGTLGADQVPTALHLHAWYGVAVPGDIENTVLGEPIRREPPKTKQPGLLKKLLGVKPTRDEQVAQQMDFMVQAYAGPCENLMIASGPRLLAEMDAAVEALELSDSEMVGRFKACTEEEDPAEIGKCYLLMSRRFLRGAVERGHLCWWMK